MTIASQTSRIGYVGDGVTTALAVPFFFSANADLVVTVQDLAGIVSTAVLGTDYSLTGATLPTGGTCIFTVAPTSGFIIAITRVPPITQLASYNNNDPFPAKSHEGALDKATTVDQYLKSLIDRAILVAPTDTPPMTTLPPATVRALKNLSFDAAGNPSVSTPVVGTTVSSAMIPVVASSTVDIARNLLSALHTSATRTVLKALDTTGTKASLLREAGREGMFVWETGDFSARVTADPGENLYIKANAISASAGAWMRVISERKRAIPSTFAPLATFGLNSLFECVAPLQAVHNIDIEAIWDEKYGSSLSGGTDLCVDWGVGNDSTGTGAFNKPFKTVKKAMQSAVDTPRRIYMLGPFSEEVPSWTAADGALIGGFARAVKLIGLATGFFFRNPNEALSGLTWSTFGNGYVATPSNTALRLHAINYVNVVGSATSQSTIIPYYGTITDVDANLFGWTQNDSTGVIYIRLGTPTLNIESIKSGLSPIFAGTPARIDGATMYIKNITFHGMTDFQVRFSQAGSTWNRPILFMDGCKVIYSSGSYNSGLLGYGMENVGGLVVTKNCEFAFATLDGVNANPDTFAGGGQEPWHVSIDDKFYSNGLQGSRGFQEFIIANPGARNIQGISYHQGLIAQINSLCYDNYGQNIAHTQSTGTGGAWLVGVKCLSPRADLQVTASATPTIFPNNNAINSRFENIYLQSVNSWVDTCSAGGRDSTYGLFFVSGGFVYNGMFDGFTAPTSGAVTPYDPSNPG